MPFDKTYYSTKAKEFRDRRAPDEYLASLDYASKKRNPQIDFTENLGEREEKLRKLLQKRGVSKKDADEALDKRRVRLGIQAPPLREQPFAWRQEKKDMKKQLTSLKRKVRRMTKRQRVMENYLSVLSEEQLMNAMEVFGEIPAEEADEDEDPNAPSTSN